MWSSKHPGRAPIRRLVLDIAADTVAPSAVALLEDPGNAAALASLADYHRIGPLVAHRLRLRRPDLEIDALTRAEVRAAAAQLHARRTVSLLNATLTMPFLIVKGPVLASEWQQLGCAREYGDLDVLVSPTNFSTALDSLGAARIAPSATNWHGFTEFGVAEVPLRHQHLSVDLHWSLVALESQRHDFFLPTQPLLERGQPIALGDTSVRTLDPVDALIHLCVNVGLDGARRLRGLVDVDLLARRAVSERREFAVRARAAGAASIANTVLQRTATLIGSDAARQLLIGSRSALRATNRALDHAYRTTPAFTSPAVPGVLVTAARDEFGATTEALASSVVQSVRRASGQVLQTDEGGDLDWQRRPTRGTIEEHRCAYVQLVDNTSRQITWRRIRDAEVLNALVTSFEPRSTPLLAVARRSGLRGHRCRADMAFGGDGRPVACIVQERWSIGRCAGIVLLLDADAAHDVAAAIDRSSMTSVAGMSEDLEPLDLRRRIISVSRDTPASYPPGFTWEDDAGDARRAVAADLDEVTDLVWQYSSHGFQNRWLLRRRIREALDDYVVVIERDGRIVGCGLRQGTTEQYDFWSDGVVEPSYRSQGLAWIMVAAAAAETSRQKRGGLTLVSDTNPMQVPADAARSSAWLTFDLGIPRRFRGEARLRAAIDALLSAAPASLPSGVGLSVQRTTGVDDDRLSDRRTQSYWRQSKNQE